MRFNPGWPRLPSGCPGWLPLVLLAEAGGALVNAAWAVPGLAALLLAGPLLAAHRLPVRVTTAVAAGAVLLAVALPVPGPPPGAGARVAGAALVAAGGVWAVVTARSHVRDRTALARTSRIAELAQRAVIRPLPPKIGDTRLAAHTRSATDGALISGDLYDAMLTPAGMRLIIGDVTGHGIGTAGLAAAVLAAFRHTAAAEPDLARLTRAIDARVTPDLGAEEFVTVVLADFRPGEVHLVNCGHPPPLRVGRRLRTVDPPDPSPPLGLSPAPRVQRVHLSPGERLLLYTDGLTDARDPRGRPLPLDRPVQAALTAPALDDALDRLLTLLRRHSSGRIDDDLTLILTQPATASPAGVPAWA